MADPLLLVPLFLLLVGALLALLHSRPLGEPTPVRAAAGLASGTVSAGCLCFPIKQAECTV